jgi:hypothetical protein
VQKHNSSRASKRASILHTPPKFPSKPPFLEDLHFLLQTWVPPLFFSFPIFSLFLSLSLRFASQGMCRRRFLFSPFPGGPRRLEQPVAAFLDELGLPPAGTSSSSEDASGATGEDRATWPPGSTARSRGSTSALLRESCTANISTVEATVRDRAFELRGCGRQHACKSVSRRSGSRELAELAGHGPRGELSHAWPAQVELPLSSRTRCSGRRP